MPWLDKEEDRAPLEACERWWEHARDEVDTIGAFRDCPHKHVFPQQSPFVGGRELGFKLATQTIISWVARKFPSLSPNPVQSIYSAINAWYADRNASRLPKQNELEEMLESSRLVLGAIHDEIFSRVRHSDPSAAASHIAAATAQAPRPEWRPATGELWFGAIRAKKIQNLGPAVNIVKILEHFQLENWPDRIDDPLPFERQLIVAKRRLHDAVKSLNTGIIGIRFLSDGTGRGIRWVADDPAAS